MFDKTNFEKLGEDIYVYHNFATDNECDRIIHYSNLIEEDLWHDNFSCYTSDISITTISEIKKRLSYLLNDNIFLNENNGLIRMQKGQSWGLHSDNHDFLQLREKASLYKEGDVFHFEKNNLYGLIIYFNDFEGGEVYYPNQNIEYKPKKGDLLIHSAEEHCLHGVKEVKSKVRYSHSSNLYNYIKVPRKYNVI